MYLDGGVGRSNVQMKNKMGEERNCEKNEGEDEEKLALQF